VNTLSDGVTNDCLVQLQDCRTRTCIMWIPLLQLQKQTLRTVNHS